MKCIATYQLDKTTGKPVRTVVRVVDEYAERIISHFDKQKDPDIYAPHYVPKSTWKREGRKRL